MSPDANLVAFLAAVERHRPDFRRVAACRGSEVNFVSRSPSEQSKAVQICRTCPAMTACRDWADEIGDTFAVLGGEDPQARRLRQRRAAA